MCSLFESGAKLVYKPRSVAMERCYYDFIAWLNDRGLDPELKVVHTLNEGAFGWDGIYFARAMRHAGGSQPLLSHAWAHTLALTSLLGGTDLHS